MSDLRLLAAAIVQDLSEQEFSPAFIAQRRALPVFDLSTAGDTVFVHVIPRSVTLEPAHRTAQYADLSIDIGVQRRIDPDVLEQSDELLALVQNISTHLFNRELAGFPGAKWLSATNDPAIAADHLHRLRVFTSVLTVTYRALRA